MYFGVCILKLLISLKSGNLRHIIILLFFLFQFQHLAIGQSGRFLLYDFDDCTFEESGLGYEALSVGGSPSCVCGLNEMSVRLDGTQDFLQLPGSVIDSLSSDFTLDFYFTLEDSGQDLDIFSLRNACVSLDSFMSLKYQASLNELSFELSSSTQNYHIIRHKLDRNNCWFRFTLVKFGLDYFVYLDNVLLNRIISRENIEFTRQGSLTFGNNPCNTITNTIRHRGLIDQISLFNRGLSERELQNFYLYPDRIVTPNTTIFSGESILIETGETCAGSINWTPAASLNNSSVAQPEATPEQSTTYSVAFNNGNCTSTDTVRIFVADRNELDCNNLLLPKAFTPNNDGLNDTYGISNRFIVEKLDFFEIFDRWGSKVWETTDLNEKWDGTKNNTPLSGGTYLYKIQYMCDNEIKVKVDNFVLMR